jgi:hypothetical protein
MDDLDPSPEYRRHIISSAAMACGSVLVELPVMNIIQFVSELPRDETSLLQI